MSVDGPRPNARFAIEASTSPVAARVVEHILHVTHDWMLCESTRMCVGVYVLRPPLGTSQELSSLYVRSSDKQFVHLMAVYGVDKNNDFVCGIVLFFDGVALKKKGFVLEEVVTL